MHAFCIFRKRIKYLVLLTLFIVLYVITSNFIFEKLVHKQTLANILIILFISNSLFLITMGKLINKLIIKIKKINVIIFKIESIMYKILIFLSIIVLLIVIILLLLKIIFENPQFYDIIIKAIIYPILLQFTLYYFFSYYLE